jgi:CRP/FNR family transcriptional regulator, cyclic AMP receptor protein
MAKRRQKLNLTRIKKIEMLAGFSDIEVQALGRIAGEVRVPAGEVIMREGDVGDSMYLFGEGQVMVTKNLTLKTGKRGFGQAEKSMVRLDARYVSFFGDMAIFENDVRSATLTAATDCLLYEIKREDFERLTQQNSALGYKFVRKIAEVLCHRLRQGNQDILKLTTALSIALSK